VHLTLLNFSIWPLVPLLLLSSVNKSWSPIIDFPSRHLRYLICWWAFCTSILVNEGSQRSLIIITYSLFTLIFTIQNICPKPPAITWLSQCIKKSCNQWTVIDNIFVQSRQLWRPVTRSRHDLWCVWWDVKLCSIYLSTSLVCTTLVWTHNFIGLLIASAYFVCRISETCGCCCCRNLSDCINDSDVTIHRSDRLHPATVSRRSFTSSTHAVLAAPVLRLPHRSSTGRATSGHSTEPYHHRADRVTIGLTLSATTSRQLRQPGTRNGATGQRIPAAGCAIGTPKLHGKRQQSTEKARHCSWRPYNASSETLPWTTSRRTRVRRHHHGMATVGSDLWPSHVLDLPRRDRHVYSLHTGHTAAN